MSGSRGGLIRGESRCFSQRYVLALTQTLTLLSSSMRFSAQGQQTNSRDGRKMFCALWRFLRLKTTTTKEVDLKLNIEVKSISRHFHVGSNFKMLLKYPANGTCKCIFYLNELLTKVVEALQTKQMKYRIYHVLPVFSIFSLHFLQNA